MVTGQLVTRTGRTAAFPSYGLSAATVGLLLLAFWLPRLSLAALPWVFGVTACFMGTVMGVVQVTIQAVAGPADAGHRRGHGAILALGRRRLRNRRGRRRAVFCPRSDDSETAKLFGAMIDHGPDAIAALAPARQAIIQTEIGEAFRAAFLTIAAFTGIGAWLAFSMPLRRV